MLLGDPDFDCMGKYLAEDADIVASPAFESGLIKIMRGITLSVDEAKACAHLKKTGEVVEQEADNMQEMSTLERLEQHRKNHKKQKVQHPTPTSNKDYIDVHTLISPTSNCCERLFSEAKYILVPHRRGMSPITFGALLYLKQNAKHWDAKTVARAMRKAAQEPESDEEEE